MDLYLTNTHSYGEPDGVRSSLRFLPAHIVTTNSLKTRYVSVRVITAVDVITIYATKSTAIQVANG